MRKNPLKTSWSYKLPPLAFQGFATEFAEICKTLNAGILFSKSYDSHVHGRKRLQSDLIKHCADWGHLCYPLQSSCADWRRLCDPLQSSLITHCADWGHLCYPLQSSLITLSADWGHLCYPLQSSLITHCADWRHLCYPLQSSLTRHCINIHYTRYSSVSSSEFQTGGDIGCQILVLYRVIKKSLYTWWLQYNKHATIF
jgi:hypothetical protein